GWPALPRPPVTWPTPRRPHPVHLATPESSNGQREPAPAPRDVVIASDPDEARRVQEEIERTLQSARCCERDIFSIRLALEEALVNAIKHGNQLDRGKKVR